MLSNREQIIDELLTAYWMEMETIQNYLANSVNLVGVRAAEIKQALDADISEELSHAKQIARRIHVLGGQIPGSRVFAARQHSAQPPSRPGDFIAVIHGVIDAEDQAIAQYRRIIDLAADHDPVTEDLCITLMADEEGHRRQFIDYLAEFECVEVFDKVRQNGSSATPNPELIQMQG